MKLKLKMLTMSVSMIAMIAIASGCNKNETSAQPPNPSLELGLTSAPTSAGSHSARLLNCRLPAILAKAGSKDSMNATDFLRSQSGKFELGEIHVYHAVETSEGLPVGAFYATARRYIGNQSYMGAKGIRETDFSFECNETAEGSPARFFSLFSIPVAGQIHAPSGRITVFDETSGSYDDPGFNYPVIFNLKYHSVGNAYLGLSKELVGSAPYNSNQYLSSVMRLYPDSAQFYGSDGNSFELRFTTEEIKQSPETDTPALKISSHVLIKYVRDLN